MRHDVHDKNIHGCENNRSRKPTNMRRHLLAVATLAMHKACTCMICTPTDGGFLSPPSHLRIVENMGKACF